MWLRGNYEDREVEIPETVLPIVATECAVILPARLLWGSRGNVISAAGAVFLDMVGGGEP